MVNGSHAFGKITTCNYFAGYDFSLLFSDYSRPFYDKRMAAECSAESLGDEWKVSGIYQELFIT